MNQLIRSFTQRYFLLCLLTMGFCVLLIFGGLLLNSFNPTYIGNVLSANASSAGGSFNSEETASLSQPALVNPQSVDECHSLRVEAEQGDLQGSFIVDKAEAERRIYVHVPQGKGDRFNGIDLEQSASYCIQVPNRGKYQLKAAVHARGVSNNSLYVRIDGLPKNGFVWNIPTTFGYAETYLTEYGLTEPLVFELDSGKHIVEFFLREDDTRLDYLQLEPVLSAASQGSSVTNSLLNVDESTPSIVGFVHTEVGDPWLPLMAEPQLSGLTVQVVDAETSGQRFATSVLTDERGTYQINDVLPGKYLIEMIVPYGHRVLGPSAIEVDVTTEQQSMASFDVLVSDRDPSFFEEYLPDDLQINNGY